MTGARVTDGCLLEALRAGQEFGLNVVRDGLIVVDAGRYREALIAVDEEGLEPQPDDEDDVDGAE